MKKKQTTILLMTLILTSCLEKKMEMPYDFVSESEFSSIDFQKINTKRIYFGHQSVGYDILRGVELAKKENSNLKVEIIEITDSFNFKNACISHSRIGENGVPRQKIDDFITYFTDSLKANVDIAFLKFCYADFERGTNMDEVFEYYVNSFEKLEKEYPKVKFIHLTVPLRVNKTGFRPIVSSILGLNNNVIREKYNNKLRAFYPANKVFDVAAIEYTKDNGKIEQNLVGTKGLCPHITYDGGHMNDKGALRLGRELVVKLINLEDM